MKVTARARRAGRWWGVEVPEVPGVFTQGKRLDQLAAMTADAVATMHGIDPADVDVTVEPVLDDPLPKQVEETRQAVELAAAAQLTASRASRALVAELRARDLSVRDIATIMGLSHQRVAQLSESSGRRHDGS